MSVLQVDTEILGQLLSELRALREEVEALRSSPPAGRPMYTFPDKIPRALVVPEKYTSTLPHLVAAALRRYASYRGGENINVVISEALRCYIPREHFEASLAELKLEQRRLWTEQAAGAEVEG